MALSTKQTCSTVQRSSSTKSVVLRPVAPRACFQPISQRAGARRAMTKVMAVAAPEVPAGLELPNNTPPPPPEVPRGYHWYETMIILNPAMSDEDRDKELAKLEAYMAKEGVTNVQVIVRGRTKLAYPMKNQWEGIYVLYNYAAKRATAKAIQLMLSTPEAGSENNVIRHITKCKA